MHGTMHAYNLRGKNTKIKEYICQTHSSLKDNLLHCVRTKAMENDRTLGIENGVDKSAQRTNPSSHTYFRELETHRVRQ